MLKEKEKKIRLQTLNHDLVIVVSNSVHDSRNKRGHVFGLHLPTENIRALHSTNGLGCSYIFMPYDADIGEIAHEAYHVCWTIMKFINAEHENEIMAYTLTFIVREVEKTIKAYKKSKKCYNKVLTNV
jgi:hypothetical protein